MTHPAGRTDRSPDFAAALERMRECYADSRYLEAWRLMQQFDAPETWSEPAALVFASRLVTNLGGYRRATALVFQANRLARYRDAEATLYRAYELNQRRGPLATWEFMRRCPPPSPSDARTQSSWLALRARVAAQFRDFDEAESQWNAALACAVEPWWLQVERTQILEMQDRYEEALSAAREALAQKPRFRPALQGEAHLLSLLNRDAEAIDRLGDAVIQSEAGSLSALRAALLLEMGREREGLEELDRAVSMQPLRESEFEKWVASRRHEAFYHLRDFPRAIEEAEKVDAPWHQDQAQRLRENAPADGSHRVLRPVPFVRQHIHTCAPATLAALTQYFGRPADHEAIAAEICYDGTRLEDEREWLRRNGWRAREFTVTWESARSLIDADIPFALATAHAMQGHLQAIIGYDSFRETLLVRDPFERSHREWKRQEFFERFAAAGPRGVAFVHGDDTLRLAALRRFELTDSRAYEELHDLRMALRRHNRPEAARCLQEIRRLTSEGRLALQSRRELAWYDRDDSAELELVEALLAEFPRDGRLRLAKFYVLHRLARPAEAEEWLILCAGEKVTEETEIDALVAFWRERAAALGSDARHSRESRQWIRRALLRLPVDGPNLATYANWLWNQADFETALPYFRFAATSRLHDEGLWRAFYRASQHFKRGGEVLTTLRRRVERFGAASSDPARTLAVILAEKNEHPEAGRVYESALALRPNDGDLLLAAADYFARTGEVERARQLLARAEPFTAAVVWRRGAAAMAEYRGDRDEALRRLNRVLEAEPLDEAAHRAIARLTAETSPAGPAAAIEFLRQAVEKFPNSVPLRLALYEWLRTRGSAADRESAVRGLLDLQPHNSWAHRELSILHMERGRHAEARAELDLALAIEPRSAVPHAIAAELALATGDPAASREAARRAIAADVNYVPGLHALVRAADSPAEISAACDCLERELERQANHGDAILVLGEVLAGTVDPARIDRILQRAHLARPDLWQAWSAWSSHLAATNRLEEARPLLASATARFPLLPRLWVERAEAESAARESDAAIESLQRAIALSPGYGYAGRALCAALRTRGRNDEADDVITSVIAANPLDEWNYISRAQLRRARGQGENALADLQRAIQLNSNNHDAWRELLDVSTRLGRPELAPQLAGELAQRRPGEAEVWFVRASVATDGTGVAERLEWLQQALDLNPRLIDAYDLRAVLLADSGRIDEALAALRPSVWKIDERPHVLLGREAWLHARRGKLELARTEMKRVVTRFPAYRWGWQCLAEWADVAKDRPAMMEAVTQLARISPEAAGPLGFLAEAKLDAGDRDGAKLDLREALRRNPAYEWGAFRLLKLEAEDRRFDEAAALVAHLANQFGADDPRHHFGLLRLACAQMDAGAAQQAIEALALGPPSTAVSLQDALAEFSTAFKPATALAVCQAALAKPGVNPEVADYWARTAVESGSGARVVNQIGELTVPAVRRRAATAAMNPFGDRKAKREIEMMVDRFDPELRADIEGWSAALYALTHAGLMDRAIAWAADWNQRENLRPWMLWNLATALRTVGNVALADQVTARAVTLPADQTMPQHHAWEGLRLALDRDVDGATKSIAAAEPIGEGQAASELARRIAEILVEFQSAENLKRAAASARRQLASALRRRAALSRDFTALHARNRALNFIAGKTGRRSDRLRASLSRWNTMFIRPVTGAAASKFRPWMIGVIAVALVNLLRACNDLQPR